MSKDVNDLARTDPIVKQKLREAIIADLDHHIGALAARERVIARRNQIDLGIAIFVHVLVVFAVAAAGFEFLAAHSTRRKTRASGALTELELGLDKVALKTSLQGVLLLAVALGFYFLYLKFAHPIDVIGPAASNSTTVSSPRLNEE